MKAYMVVYTVDGQHGAGFYENYAEARNAMMDIECGMGGYAELYARKEYEDSDQPAEYIMIE